MACSAKLYSKSPDSQRKFDGKVSNLKVSTVSSHGISNETYVDAGVTRFGFCKYTGHLVNSSPPGQNGRHFAGDIFRCIFVNETFCILD